MPNPRASVMQSPFKTFSEQIIGVNLQKAKAENTVRNNISP